MVSYVRDLRIIITYIIFLFSSFVHAQEDACSEEFANIQQGCALAYTSQMQEGTLFKWKTETLDQVYGRVFFYQTADEKVGKFIVRAAMASEKECSLYLEASTFVGNETFSPTASFSIVNKYNTWGTDAGTFGQGAESDFQLLRVKDECVFKTSSAKFFSYKKIKLEDPTEGNALLWYAGMFLIGLAVFISSRAFFEDEDRFQMSEKLEDSDVDSAKKVSKDIVLKYSRPFFKRYFTPVVSGMKNKKGIRERYKKPLANAGLTQELTPEDFFAFKLFLIIGFPIVFLALREFLEESWPLSLLPVISIGGFMYPDTWLKGKIAKRKEDMIQAMPFIVDLLALSVEAGLDFVAAMQRVIEKAPPSALAEEFEIMIKETKIGSSRAEALRQMAWRANTIEVASFTATLIAADSVGASIGPILKGLAVEMRGKRSALAEKKGATAATKIMIPLAIFIIPAVFIMILGPIGIQAMMAGG